MADEMTSAIARARELADLFEHALDTPGYGQDALSREEAETQLRKTRAALDAVADPKPDVVPSMP